MDKNKCNKHQNETSQEIAVPQSKKNKSSIMKLAKLVGLFCGETITLYGLLRLSRLIISKLNLPKQNVLICLLSCIYAYKVNKYFNFFRYEWTLMLLIKTISTLIVNKIPKNQRLSKTNTSIIFGALMLYFPMYKLKNTSKSYGYFADKCYFQGGFNDLMMRSKKYYNNLETNPHDTNCCDMHEEHEGKSCTYFLLNRALFLTKNIFKWYFKFYLLIAMIWTLKKSGVKTVFAPTKLMQVIKKSLKSALGSTWNNALLCLLTFYAVPCITENVCNKSKFNVNIHKALILLFYLPIAQKLALFPEPVSRHSQLTIFFIAETIKWSINEYQDIEYQNKNETNILQKNKDCLFAIYVFISIATCAMNSKRSSNKGAVDKLINSVLTKVSQEGLDV